MDENYLDDLLKGVSNENQKKNSFDKTVEHDSGIDIDLGDLDDISLDELDSLDDISLEGLDFDEIDFDDLDVTNLESSNNTKTEFKPEEEEFDADDLLEGIENIEEMQKLEEELEAAPSDSMMGEAPNVGLTSEDIDNLFSQIDSEELDTSSEHLDATGMMEAIAGYDDSEGVDGLSALKELEGMSGIKDMGASDDVESMDLDDLFSALGIDETEGVGTGDFLSGEDELEQLLKSTMATGFAEGDLSDIEDIHDKQKSKKGKHKAPKSDKDKKSMSEILFGAPDEDDEEEERLFQIKKAEKANKKELKKEAKEAKKIEKQEKLAQKDTDKEKKKLEKTEKKRLKEAALYAENEAELGQKKVPTMVVVLVFVVFAVLTVVVVFGAKGFSYGQAVKKATDYFERQRYRLAYDEVAGIEVKDEDEQLRDRIYTVMYVERLYESYDNNMTLGRPDKALDSLLRGLQKYDEHYEEALYLGIAKDVKSVKEKIVNELWNTYGLSESEAYQIMELEGTEYSDALAELTKELMTTGD